MTQLRVSRVLGAFLIGVRVYRRDVVTVHLPRGSVLFGVPRKYVIVRRGWQGNQVTLLCVRAEASIF